MFPARQPRRAAPCELRESCPSLAAYKSENHRCNSSTGCRESRRESQAVRAEPGRLAGGRLPLQGLAHFLRRPGRGFAPQVAARVPRTLLRRGEFVAAEAALSTP